MPSGLPLVHLYPALVVELGGTSKTPALVRDRLSLTMERKLWWKVCYTPILSREGCFWQKKAKAVDVAFFSLTDGS